MGDRSSEGRMLPSSQKVQLYYPLELPTMVLVRGCSTDKDATSGHTSLPTRDGQ